MLPSVIGGRGTAEVTNNATDCSANRDAHGGGRTTRPWCFEMFVVTLRCAKKQPFKQDEFDGQTS
jgi:hypothetical protein